MAYTALNACDTFRNYLKEIGISDNNITLIPETKNRGIILTLDGLEKIVIFIYPIVSKQDGTKKYFDTRDSGPHERAKTWNYSIQNKLKYFCLGINDQVEKYKNYIFSLECNEKDIELLSGTEAGDRNGKGNQIIIPNDFTPNKSFQRIVNNLGTYIAVINKNDLISYLEKFDNRPYLLDKEEIDINNIQNISFYDSPNLNKLKGCNIIYYGAHSDDAAGSAYPDCSKVFNNAMNQAIYEGSGHQLEIKAPFVEMTKADIVKIGLSLGVPYQLTWSCYEGNDTPCGTCGTCIDRQNAFLKNGIKDPLLGE